jgi:hypothetical protein
MLENKYIKHNNKKYYLIDTMEFGSNLHDYELYESCTYGEDVPQLIVNSTTNKAIGWTCNGFDELIDNEFTETAIQTYTLL